MREPIIVPHVYRLSYEIYRDGRKCYVIDWISSKESANIRVQRIKDLGGTVLSLERYSKDEPTT